ncbi:MAG: hypothetical protein ACLFSB_10240 [Chitinispirillaceae bacterium]
MKKLLMSIFIFLTMSLSIDAQDRNVPLFEFGVLLGEPLGLSAKWWHSTVRAWDFAAAWSFTEDGLFEVHTDYLFHIIYPAIDAGELPIYTGLGFALRIGNEWFMGPRIPVGVEYIFERLPLAVFGEVVPQYQLLPDNTFVLSGGVGFRIALGQVD